MNVPDILLIIGIVVAGVAAGARVQKGARFIYPTDIFTVGMLFFAAADLVSGACGCFSTGIRPVWYLAFVTGYFTGYLVVGRTSYVMVWTMDLPSRTSSMKPAVIWTEGSETFLQPQHNRDLLRRALFGVKHAVVSNVPLEANWVTEAKYPMLMAFRKRTLMVEEIATGFTVSKMFWKFGIRKYVTEMTVAYGGMVSKARLAHDQGSLRELQDQNVRLTDEIHGLRKRMGPLLMEMALRLESDVGASAPVNRMFDLMDRGRKRKGKEKKEKEKVGENGSDAEKDCPEVQP